MRARAAAAAALASFGILAAGWQVGAQAIEASKVTGVTTSGTTGTSGSTTASGAGSSGTGSSGTGSSGTGGTTAGGTSTASSSQGSSSTALKSGTFAGAVESTRYGDVQVQIVVSGGKITDVQALHLTDAEMRSEMISANAAPVLRSEVLQAQSANVDTVGGATITSDAYLSSLQAALDAAHA